MSVGLVHSAAGATDAQKTPRPRLPRPRRGGHFYFGGEEGQEVETVTFGKDDALPIPKRTIHDYEGRTRLFLSHSPAYDVQDSDVHYDDPWE